jgi:RNA-directed DNA polymerase
MSDATTSTNMSPGLLMVAERARNYPGERILAVARFIDEPALARSYRRLRKDAAVGIDGITVEQYGQNLDEKLRDLHERMKSMKYRHQPIRRVHIPKGRGKTRPIGVACVEDKIVQGALREVLEAIYEQDFLNCSYGFRPGRSAHDAIRALNQAVRRGVAKFILEADVVSFFDSLDRKGLAEMLRERIADESLMRLIGKCLHVGVLEDGEEYSEPEVGTVQGSGLSPLLGNVYLHHVLDRWFEREVKPKLRGEAVLLRFCDDFVITFERQDDAEQVMVELSERMNAYHLTLHPEKTRLLEFRPPKRSGKGKGTATFDFLGFTMYWKRTRRGKWDLWCKTRRASLRRIILAVADWCRRHRHLSVKDQHAALTRRVQGHFNYFGINGNRRSLHQVVQRVERLWHKWLNRRSNRSRLTWERFKDLLRDFPLPRPRIVIQIWVREP